MFAFPKDRQRNFYPNLTTGANNKLKSINRRNFVQLAGAACISNAIQPAFAQSSPTASASSSSPIRLGVVIWIKEGQTPDEAVKSVHDLGLPTCQIGFEHLTPDVTGPVKAALAKYGVEATAFSEHGPGRRIFNFYQGPETVGIIPPATRAARIQNLKMASDIAVKCNIPAVHTHCGFIPENPNDPLYPQAVAAVKEIGSYCKQRGQIFLCETGQETPITLLRLIEDTGLDNVFVNMDVANLILYGKGNPVDAMDVVGHRVRGVHAKDGLFPTNPKELGEEVIIGKGKVDFPTVFQQLKQVNYKGAMTIERETQGEQQKKDILQSKIFLNNLIAKTYS
jgi:sugar phosphate isomerase/epimerase